MIKEESGKNPNISKIDCHVENCSYHDMKNRCCADHITVGPEIADTSKGTNCATFKKK